MGEDAVVGEVVGEETTTQRRGFWAKNKSARNNAPGYGFRGSPG